MKKPEKTNGSQASVQHPANGNHDGLSPMPDESGMYQAGYEAGYSGGREAGYGRGYTAGYADGGKHNNVSTDTAAAVPTNASGIRRPRRLLLGLPCPNCRVYSSTEEALCPCCKTPTVSAQNGRNQFAVTGDTSVSLKNIAASTRPIDTESSSSSEEELQLQL
jgi:hypothetical protein